MKLGMCMVFGAAGLGSLGLAASLSLQGCSSSDSSADAGTTTSGPGKSPPASSGAPTTSTTEMNFAVRKVMLGDGPTGKEWQSYGYDIDGQTTDSSYKNACTPVGTGTKSKLIDGPGGIDNSFGENIVSLISAVAANPSTTISNTIEKGTFTIMIDTVGLSSDPAQTATGLSAKLLGGYPFNQAPNDTAPTTAPKWDGTDNWPVNSGFLTSATDVTSAKIKFASAYVANGTWVSGPRANAQISLTISGVALTLPISNAVITFDHKTPNLAANGQISGVVKTTDLIENLRGVAGNISSSLCSGSAFDQIAASITAASDILSDGTNKAGVDCDAISIGLGFEADLIAPPAVVGHPAAGTNACGDAGAAPADGG